MAKSLTLCRSDAGDGGWSLHPPGSIEWEIATGDALTLASGEADMVDGAWNRPDATDYRDAWLMFGPNGTTAIAIEMTSGRADEDDMERARGAAAACLNEHGILARHAFSEYQRQWAGYDDEDRMTGLALIWIDARNAADLALTEGWADPNGASCTIYA